MRKEQTDPGQLSRRGFLQTSAVAATGVAVVVAPAAAVVALDHRSAAGALPAAVATQPSGAAPAEPVMAYLRDAARGEVTVMSGTTETTYKDPILAQRLVDAAGQAAINGEGI